MLLLRHLARRARPRSSRRSLKLWVPRDEASMQRNAIAAVLHEYTQMQVKTAEQIVPWFLEVMPESYFRLIGADERLQHLKAIASIHAQLVARAAGALDDDGLELRVATESGATRHVTFLTVGNRAGTLLRQVIQMSRGNGRNGVLSQLRVFTADDGSLCLNVFEFENAARLAPQLSSAQDNTLRRHKATQAHQAYAADHGGAAESVEAHALRCPLAYLEMTRPLRWSLQRALFESVVGTEDVAVRVDAAHEVGSSSSLAPAWVSVAAPDTVPISFLQKLLRVLAALRVDVQRCCLDLVDGDDGTKVAMVRVLVSPDAGVRGYFERGLDSEGGGAAAHDDCDCDDDAAAGWRTIRHLARRVKWLDDDALDSFVRDAEALPLGAWPRCEDVVRCETLSALCSLAHRALASSDASAFSLCNVRRILSHPRNAAYPAVARDVAELILDREQGPIRTQRADALRARVDAATAGVDSVANEVLRAFVNFAEACEACNAGRDERYALSFKFDASRLAIGTAEQFPQQPYGVIYVHGRRFDAFHVRFREIARGGVRLVTPRSPEGYALDSARHYAECYGLAAAQQLKNKDIPEGGSKGVILVDATPPAAAASGRADKDKVEFHAYLCRKSVKACTDAILDLFVETGCGPVRAPVLDEDVTEDLEESSASSSADNNTRESRSRDMVYLGPDEQITPADIVWIVENARRRGHPTPDAFMSSKPDAGINHKEFGVTSEGVHVFLEAALRDQGVDPATDVFTLKLTGGPDGDVAGNALTILFRECAGAKVVGIADASGCAEDPDGLSRSELARLVACALPVAAFDPQLLSARGAVYDAATDAGASMRDSMHNRVKSDVFVPAGGRPATLNGANYKSFLDAETGAPSSMIIVEGANLFVTPEARAALFREARVRIVKDSSANKCGVICSSYEILAAHVLSSEEFEQRKPEIVAEILCKLRELARLEAELLFREHGSFVGALPDFSQRISNAINQVTDAVLAALHDPKHTASAERLFTELAPEHLPPILAERAVQRIDALPRGYVPAAVASFVASRLVYAEGLAYVEALPEERLATVALAFVAAQRECHQTIAAVAASDLDNDTKRAVAAFLRPRLT